MRTKFHKKFNQWLREKEEKKQKQNRSYDFSLFIIIMLISILHLPTIVWSFLKYLVNDKTYIQTLAEDEQFKEDLERGKR